MTPSAKEKMAECYRRDIDKEPNGERSQWIYESGFTAGHAVRDEETHGGIARELTEISPRELTLIKALRFYADKSSWLHGIAYSQNNLLVESDMYLYRGDYFYGGKLARQTLESMGIPLKEGE